jgi:hypothetical protein
MSSYELVPEDGPLLSEHEVEKEKQERIIGELMQQVSQLFNSVDQLARMEDFPEDTPDLLRELCLVQRTLLEERLHALKPELHPQTNIAGTEYSHRNEILATLRGVMMTVEGRNVRTIDVKAEEV